MPIDNAQAVDKPPNHMDTTHSGRQSANAHENYYYYYYYYYFYYYYYYYYY